LSVATTLLELLGLAAIVAGVAMIFVPAAWIVGGAGLVLVGALAGRPPVRVVEPRSGP
jgi:hypothetical protein